EASVTSSKPDLPTQTKKLIILGDYGFLQITPAFLKNEYLERELKDTEKGNVLREFSEKIKKISGIIKSGLLSINSLPLSKKRYSPPPGFANCIAILQAKVSNSGKTNPAKAKKEKAKEAVKIP
ncbi:7748_t:CDS:2, partial [Funneliformis geosporum]